MNIFFSVDEGFVPYLSVMIASMMAHASEGKRYELHVLESGLNPDYQRMLLRQIGGTAGFLWTLWMSGSTFRGAASTRRAGRT